MSFDWSQRPILVVLAGPNGAGKSTFYHAHLKAAGLRFLNADLIAKELRIDSQQAAALAADYRGTLLAARESFVFETVLSDPVGDKIEFFARAAAEGYAVMVLFIGISGPARSEERVSMRVAQGGHDVPSDRIAQRYPRVMENLKRAIARLPAVNIYDNDDLRTPYRLIAEARAGKVTAVGPLPAWFRKLKLGA